MFSSFPFVGWSSAGEGLHDVFFQVAWKFRGTRDIVFDVVQATRCHHLNVIGVGGDVGRSWNEHEGNTDDEDSKVDVNDCCGKETALKDWIDGCFGYSCRGRMSVLEVLVFGKTAGGIGTRRKVYSM